jgi:Uma2 family endonuclease
MVQAKPRFTSIEEYAALDTSDLPECPFELVDGVIVEMPTENFINLQIAGFLVSILLQFVPHYLIIWGVEIEVASRSVTSRCPDLLVLTDAGFNALPRDKRAIMRKDMPPPALVIEVVSPGGESSDNYQRDYIRKRQEYAERGIPEYWLIDPIRELVLVMRLDGAAYQMQEFRESALVISCAFPNLQLTAEQILNAGR